MSELEWIDKSATQERVSMYRTAAGWHYEGESPRSSSDVEVAYRVRTVTSGRVLGDHAEMGTVLLEMGEVPVTTLFPVADDGPWIQLDTPDLPT